MRYYRYQTSEDEAIGRAIDPKPIVSVLLEPRSLVITTKELYTTFLHGIENIAEDEFDPESIEVDHPHIANWQMIKEPELRACLENGGSMSRSTRISLTCRDVEKVMAGSKLFGRNK